MLPVPTFVSGGEVGVPCRLPEVRVISALLGAESMPHNSIVLSNTSFPCIMLLHVYIIHVPIVFSTCLYCVLDIIARRELFKSAYFHLL